MAAETPTFYSVAVVLLRGDHSTLLALASALHRRGVDVLAAELTWPTARGRTFAATIMATPRQARTVEATLRNLVITTDAQVTPHFHEIAESRSSL